MIVLLGNKREESFSFLLNCGQITIFFFFQLYAYAKMRSFKQKRLCKLISCFSFFCYFSFLVTSCFSFCYLLFRRNAYSVCACVCVYLFNFSFASCYFITPHINSTMVKNHIQLQMLCSSKIQLIC